MQNLNKYNEHDLRSKTLYGFIQPAQDKFNLTKSGREDLGRAVFKAISRIINDLSITQAELAEILHVPQSTLSGWFKNRKVPFASNFSANDKVVLNFLDLYDAITSLHVEKKDWKEWYRKPLYGKDISPIELMKIDPLNVIGLNKYINWLLNP